MSHKKKHATRVPPGNRSGSASQPAEAEQLPATKEGAPFQEQDPKRRLGNYGGAGEHPYQQPGGLNDANH